MNDRRGDDKESLATTGAKRKADERSRNDRRGDSGATAVRHLFAAAKFEVEGHRGKHRQDHHATTPQPARKCNSSNGRMHAAQGNYLHVDSGCRVVDSLSPSARQRPPLMGVANNHACADHCDASSVKLTFTTRAMVQFAPLLQQSEGDVDTPLRRPFRPHDVKFEEKNFGDSILGDYRGSESLCTAGGSHDRCFSTGSTIGDGHSGHPVGIGGAWTSYSDSAWRSRTPSFFSASPSSDAAFCGTDVRNSCRPGGGGMSPEALPLTPSPLSLNRSALYSITSLLGF